MNRKALLSFFLLSLLSVIVIVPARAQTINSGWTDTPPTIDGVKSVGEWDDATMVQHDWGWGSGAIPIMWVHVMNDAINLYVLIEIEDDDTTVGDDVRIFFDNLHLSGSSPVDNDDMIKLVNDDTYGDYYYDSGMPAYYFDTTGSGSTDGQGSCGQIAVIYYFELSHPLCSGDIRDFCLSLGQTVGFTIYFSDGGDGSGYWPGDASYPYEYGDIIIAQRPEKPEAVGGDVLLADKLELLTPCLIMAIVVLTAATVLIKKRKH